MNTTPRINWNGHKGEITNPGCGFEAMDNVARAFWQSRMSVAGQPAALPELTDIPVMARELRRTYFDQPVMA